MAKLPKNFESRLLISGSSTIMAVPITVRMISGRKRIRSVELTRLAAIVRLQYHGMALLNFYADGDIEAGLIEHSRGRLSHRLQEALRVNAHPHHHQNQRNNSRPLAQFHVWHVVANFVGGLAVEDALIEPEHIAGGENRAQRGPNGPTEIGHGSSL